MYKKSLLLLFILALLTGSLAAQRKHSAKRGEAKQPMTTRPHLTAVARSDQDSIILRWAPNTALGWLAGNKLGYTVERVTMLKDPKAARATFHRLSANPIKPWTLDEWKAHISNNDRYAAVAVQALFGKNFTPKTSQGPMAALKDAADELTNRFGFSLFAADIDPLAATGLGLRLVDKDITRGETYSYRIFLAGKDSLLRLDTAFTIASALPFVQPPAPIELTAEPGEHAVTLRWKSPVDPRGGYTAYNIYRSTDTDKNFKRLNDLPFVTATGEKERMEGRQQFTDTSAVDYHRYHYRIEGITPFGDAGEPAETEGMAVDLTSPPPPHIKKPVQLGMHAVRIEWEMPVTTPDLAGFVVSRSSFALKNFHLLLRSGTRMPSPGKGASAETRELMKLILPVGTHSFIDSSASTSEPYYIVGAVDTAGNLAQSLPAYSETIDTTRPAMPRGLTGTIDNRGYIHLHWNLGPERNIIGYRVMWANEPDHEFSQRVNEPLPDTLFADSVNIHTLSHFVFYRVAAVTDRYIQSPPSAILALRRPDVVPPASPVFLDVHVTETSVLLHWAGSPSDDVEKQILLRRVQGNEEWKLLHTLGTSETQFLDTAVTEKVMYEYSIEAVDSSGLHSPPSPAVQARPYDSGVRPSVTDLTIRYDAKSKQVKLNWKYTPRKKERYWFVVYRAEDQALVTEYSSVAGTQHEFQDQHVQKSVSYRYAIRVKTDGGGESPLSQPAVIRLPEK